MNIVNGKDFLEVKLASLIADYDLETLTNLYQPIIGYQALAVYLTLWSEGKNQKITSLINHETLFARLQMAPGDFVEARKALEGLGLIKTFMNKAKDIVIYEYEIYAPKTPKSFFDNALLNGLLIKSIGEANANRFQAIYHFEAPAHEGSEISASFVEVYHPDYDNPAFAKVLSGSSCSIGRVGGKIVTVFSYEKFFNALSSISQISEAAFNKKDMKEIERLATLYGVDELIAANDVVEVYSPASPKGSRIDFEALNKHFQDETNFNYLSIKRNGQRPNIISGESDLAKKINLIETASPKDYLSALQNGTKPATADLRLINDLSSNFHLTNAVINAVIDFVLTVNQNILNRSYCEKVSASLAREGLTTAVDAMNYLYKVRGKDKKTEKKSYVSHPPKIETEDKKPEKQEEDSSVNWEQMIDDLDTGGGSDGKA